MSASELTAQKPQMPLQQTLLQSERFFTMEPNTLLASLQRQNVLFLLQNLLLQIPVFLLVAHANVLACCILIGINLIMSSPCWKRRRDLLLVNTV